MDSFSAFAYNHGKFRAFVVIGVTAFLAAFLLYALISAPFAALGFVAWKTVLFGALGCSIGTGAVNSLFAAMSA